MKIKLSVIFAIVLSVPWILMQLWLFVAPGLYPNERRFIHILLPGSALLTAAGLSIMYLVMLPIMLYVLMSITAGIGMAPQLIPQVAADLIDQAVITLPLLPTPPEAAQLGQAWVNETTSMLQIAVASDTPDALRILSLPLQGDSVVAQIFRLTSYINFVLLLLMGITVAFQMPLVILLLGWIGIVTPDWLAKKRKWALLVCAILAAITTPADVVSMFLMLIPLYMLYELGIVLLRVLPANRVGKPARDEPAS
jgi:sec-independent protein translocase protein TatC